MSGEATLLAEGFGFAEGPLPLPDGRVVLCDGTSGALLVWDATHGVAVLAETGGGPNGTLLAADGEILVAQFGSWAPGARTCAPGLQRVSGGRVERLAAGPLVAPNDLVWGPDRALWITDSGSHDHVAPDGPGRILTGDTNALAPVLELGPVFPNGIGFDADRRLVWTESTTRRVRRLDPDGPTTLCTLPEGSIPDGMAAAADGRLFVATTTSGGITVLAQDGTLLHHLDVGPWPTSCRFRGSALVITAVEDFTGETGTGSLWIVDVGVSGADDPRSLSA